MRNTFFTICILLSTFRGQATHIVGGAFSLQHISGTSYKLTLKVYRDCLNGQAPFDDPAVVGVFDKATNNLIQTFQLSFDSTAELPFIGANCNQSLPDGCTDVAYYRKTITLSTTKFNNTAGYYFSYQRCCRNGVIQNILQPGDAGIAIYMEIPSPKLYINSTPDYTANVNALFCKDKLTMHNFKFTDADGDVLKFSMTTPLNGNLDKTNPSLFTPSNGPYPEVSWAGSFNNQQQIIGNPSLQIDENSGEISTSPAAIGTYAIAVKVEEYRAGIKIGEVHLELQFTVSECPQQAPTITFTNRFGGFLGNLQTLVIPDQICLNINATDPTDSLFMQITNISDDTMINIQPTFSQYIEGNLSIINQICWEANCDLPPNYALKLKVEVRDNGCPKNALSTAILTINTVPMPLINPTKLLCMTLIDNKETLLYWGDSTGNNPIFVKYYLYRSIGSSPFIILDSIFDKSINNYHDFNTPNYTSTNYRYFIRGVNKCEALGPTSDTLGTFKQLKFIPDQQQLITATVENNKYIRLEWPKTYKKDFARYFVYKKLAKENNYNLIYETTDINDTNIIDTKVDVMNHSYCYHVVMKDTCDNIGPMGKEACTILLKGFSNPFSNTLNWTPYNYWSSGTNNYQVNVIGNNTPHISFYTVDAKDTFITDSKLDFNSAFYTYFIVANQKNNPTIVNGGGETMNYLAASKSNEIILSQKPALYVPDAFTPNSDGLNDTWDIKNLFIYEYSLQVYNKWGQLIFKTDNSAVNWDGKTLDGDYAPGDVYVYTITYSGFDGFMHNQNGNVTILR